MKRNDKMNIKLIFGCTAILTTFLLSSCSTSDIQSAVGNGTAVTNDNVKHAPTDSSKVRLYFGNQNLPKHYRIIGHVSADNYALMAFPYSQESIAQHLKEQAAAIGGTGVINIDTGLDRTTGDIITK
jgi:hypothetical protein